MPVPPDHPGVLRIKHNWNVGSDLSVGTTLHFTYTGTAPSNAVCATIEADCYALAVTNLVPLLCDDNYLTGVDVTDLTSPSSGNGVHVASQVGTRAGLPLPAATCVLSRFGISRRYRGGKPRQYWPFGVEGDLASPQAWAGGSVTAFLTGLATYIDGVIVIVESGTAISTMVNISNYAGFNTVGPDLEGRFHYPPKLRAVAIAPDPFVGFTVSARPATQRRRALNA